MKVLGSYKDAEAAARAVAASMKHAGEVPPVLLDSIRRSLGFAGPGVVQRFFFTLTEECPEALALFKGVERARGE